MSEDFEEFMNKEEANFNNIMSPIDLYYYNSSMMSLEELETFEIIYGNNVNSTNITQLFSSKNDCETSNKAMSDTNIVNNQFSESDEESYEEDFWDEFELEKPIKLKFVNNFGDKVPKKDLNKRHKALVRYKTVPVIEFDEQTKYLLQKLIATKHMSYYSHIIGTGSNSIVIMGYSGNHYAMRRPWRVVVKVYKNGNNSEALYKKVQNEFQSLDRMYRCGIRCPKPVCAWRNIIVMGAIGCDKTEPSILNHPLGFDIEKYFKIIHCMRTMYQMAKVVHGNLSSSTILSDDYYHAFIGLSKSVPADHPEALNLLMRDCYSVTNLFKDKQSSELKTTEELFKYVTDLPEIDEKLLEMLQNMKPSDFKCHSVSYDSKCATEKPSVNYSSILAFCTKLNRRRTPY